MPDFANLAWLTMLHASWLGLLAGSLASLSAALARPASAGARHAAIVGLLAVVAIAAPGAATVQQSWFRRAIIPATVRATVGPESSRPAMRVVETVPLPASPPEIRAFGDRDAGLGRLVSAAGSVLELARPYLLAGWAAGASAFLGAMAVGGHSLRRLGREAAPCPAAGRRARALGRMLRLQRTPDVLRHPRLAEPCLAGVVRPMVLLPSRWLESAPDAELVAVLAHELAHARRLDHFTNLFLRAIEAAFWFHPAVHVASRIARREAERASDSLAVRLTGDPLALARALDSVARSRPSRPQLLHPGLAIGGDRSTLLPRIQELLGMKPNRPRFPLGVLATLPMVAALATIAATAQTPPSKVPARPATGHAIKTNPNLGLERGELLGFPPEELSDADLVRRIRSFRPDAPDLSGLDRQALLKLAECGQIGFEVRYLTLNRTTWESRAGEGFRKVGKGPGRQGWLADKATVHGLLRTATNDKDSNILQAPKVTTFEGIEATVISGNAIDSPTGPRRALVELSATAEPSDDRLPYVLRGPVPDEGRGERPIVNGGGWCEIRMSGRIGQASHRIEARTTCGLDLEPERPWTEAEAARVGRPFVARRVECDVPDGDSLVIDSGWDLNARRDDVPLRHLLVITPYRIILEAETSEKEPATSGTE